MGRIIEVLHRDRGLPHSEWLGANPFSGAGAPNNRKNRMFKRLQDYLNK